MNSRHYFSNNDDLKSKRKEVSFRFLNHIDLKFISDNGVFSKDGIDYGSCFLLEEIIKHENPSSLLDVGCGYGLIGITLAKYFNIETDMIDINNRAIQLSEENIKLNQIKANVFESNLFESVNKKYDLIITNPPIRAGKKVIYSLFEQAKNYLNDNGSLWIVIRKQHGAESALKYLNSVEFKAEVIEKSKGFWVIRAKIS